MKNHIDKLLKLLIALVKIDGGKRSITITTKTTRTDARNQSTSNLRGRPQGCAYNLIFGYNKKENKSFSAYIGLIIIIKNPSNSKEVKNNDLIPLFLKLFQNNYPNFIFLYSNSNYSF